MVTRSVEEAILELYGVVIDGRRWLFKEKGMDDEAALAYHQLGMSKRSETYQAISRDFMSATGYIEGEVLEVGCGSGLLTKNLQENVKGNVIGIDNSALMITLARKYAPNVEFEEKDLFEVTKKVPYIVCRNVLHRIQHDEAAIEQMHSLLMPGGKLYIRDLKRDADWSIILERIGDERWKTSALVEDYLTAMASMRTMEELSTMLDEKEYTYSLREGFYQLDTHINFPKTFQEYAKEVEYVCVIEK